MTRPEDPKAPQSRGTETSDPEKPSAQAAKPDPVDDDPSEPSGETIPEDAPRDDPAPEDAPQDASKDDATGDSAEKSGSEAASKHKTDHADASEDASTGKPAPEGSGGAKDSKTAPGASEEAKEAEKATSDPHAAADSPGKAAETTSNGSADKPDEAAEGGEAALPEPPLFKPDRRVTLAVILLCGLIYIPFAGSYGLWDPWETHYGEVARTMLQRHDYITTYWQDELFKSKPVLTFWMQALGMAALGVNQDGAPSSELALSTTAEWGMRLPIVLAAIFCLFAVYLLVARVIGRRAAVLSTLVCATCPQFALISRQSITDIPFAAFMTAALCFFLLGLFADEEEETPVHRLRLGRFEIGLTTWHLFSAIFLLLVIPQLYLLVFDIGWQFQRALPLGGTSRLQMYGLPYALPWLALLGFYLVSTFSMGTRKARHVYVHAAWLLCGLAVLAKGLGGIAIPVAVVGVYVVLCRDFSLISRLELLRGTAVFLLVAAPWHHAMWVRHGRAWWNEYFGHHHFKRAQVGVHGERGTLEYFVHQLGVGLFPWSALIPAAVVRWAGTIGRPQTRRARLVLFALVWATVVFSLFSIMETKFHHYALPAIPPLAILLGLWLDELADDLRPQAAIGVVLGLGLMLVIARDLYRDPQHLVLMFIYKYDRLFPYELSFEPWILWLSVPIALSLAAMLVPSWRRIAVWTLAGSAVLFTLWVLDGYQIQLSPHWGQKNLHAIYHKARRGPEERLIAWQLNWRGENFYSKNQVVVHMQPKDTPKFKAYLRRHKGERFYLVMEPGRFGTLKSILKQVGASPPEPVGPGGKSWPDNWIYHFRTQNLKVLYRERSRLSKTCRKYKARLQALTIPAGAGRWKGTQMGDTWWDGHCQKFVQAEQSSLAKRCEAPTASRAGCQQERREARRHAALCRAARRALGPYPYPPCFELYPNNKFLLVRFSM